MTSKDLIKKAIIELKKAGSDTPDLDVRVLLSHALDKDSVFLLSHPENLLTNREYQKFRKFIRRRKALEPVAYITGSKDFYGYKFTVNKNVLIPRPESEFLVEKALEIIEKTKKPMKVLDMGTGSGCLILSLAKELNKRNHSFPISYFAADNSVKALSVAKKNAQLLGIKEKIKFYQSDLFSNCFIQKKFDLMIANLPYVPTKGKSSKKQPIDFEPKEAIFADDHGTKIIKDFLVQARRYKNGPIFMETDSQNADNIACFAKTIFPNKKVEIKKDIASLDRYVLVT